MNTHILAMGGGGWCGPKGGPSPMLKYFLKLTGKQFPKVCLIPTATGDRAETVHEWTYAINRLGAHPNFLSLYHIPSRDIESFVMDFDAIYVSGGNTKNLLALWREWDLDTILKKAWKRGVVLGGASAGGICWFEQGSTDSWPNEYNPLDAMGWLTGSFCPHFTGEKGRRESYLAMVADGRLKDGYGVTDRAALHYVNGRLKAAVGEWEEAAVFRIRRTGKGAIKETGIALRFLA
jgi:dipeptidase E